MTALTKEDVKELLEELRSEIKCELKQVKEEIVSELQKQIDKKFKNVHVKINEIKNTADEALKTAKYNEDQLQRVKVTIDELNDKQEQHSKENIKLCKQVDIQAVRIGTPRYRLEDQTNRDLRKTLVFKGIPEQGIESWSKSRSFQTKSWKYAMSINMKLRIYLNVSIEVLQNPGIKANETSLPDSTTGSNQNICERGILESKSEWQQWGRLCGAEIWP